MQKKNALECLSECCVIQFQIFLGLEGVNGPHLLIFNNPGNPSGAVYSRPELEAIVEVLKPGRDYLEKQRAVCFRKSIWCIKVFFSTDFRITENIKIL